ncbi:MAG: AraC family transcriptional regulator [Myxococcota bacterium]
MPDRDPWVERILRVVDHVHAHLDEELQPEDLAKIAHFSLHHFHRVFRGMTGESVMGFVRRLRLERAAQRLKFGDESVTSVALTTGYGSHEAFTRAFRARFGTNPREYRERERAEPLKRVKIEVREEPEHCCVGIRYVGPYEGCAVAWADLTEIVDPTELDEYPDSFGLVYDDPEVTAPEQLRYDACFAVPSDALPSPLHPRLTVRVVPAGRYAVALYQGPYEDIFETYVTLLGRWLPRRGVELWDEPVVEAYLNNPDTAAPEDLLTEVRMRIR